MNSEIGIYVYRNRERLFDWRSVVIYPSRSIEQSRIETVREMLASDRIIRVYLDELGQIDELPTGLGLMVLTTLEGDNAIDEARGLIERSSASKAIIDLVSTIMVYKFNTLSRDEVNVMLGIELQQTRVYQEAVAEGEARGEARGKTEEGRSLVIRQLNRKLGNLSPQLQERVNSLQLDRIESLGEALLDFSSMADLETWLSHN